MDLCVSRHPSQGLENQWYPLDKPNGGPASEQYFGCATQIPPTLPSHSHLNFSARNGIMPLSCQKVTRGSLLPVGPSGELLQIIDLYFSCLCSWYSPSVSLSPPHTFLFLPYPKVTTALYICCLAYQYLYLSSTCSLHRLSQQSRNSNFSELLKHITDTTGGYLYIALYCGCVSLERTSCKLHLCLPNCSTKIPCSRMWHFIPQQCQSCT